MANPTEYKLVGTSGPDANFDAHYIWENSEAYWQQVKEGLQKNMNMKEERIKCTHCNMVLNNKKIAWLELSMTDGHYYLILPLGHESQGCFPFGVDCSKKIAKEYESKRVF